MNKVINNLPLEFHIPRYQYCGPGDKLTKRLVRSDPGINRLNKACKEHDIVYSHNIENITARNTANKVLAENAWNLVLARDVKICKKAAAGAVTNAMKMSLQVRTSMIERCIRSMNFFQSYHQDIK